MTRHEKLWILPVCGCFLFYHFHTCDWGLNERLRLALHPTASIVPKGKGTQYSTGVWLGVILAGKGVDLGGFFAVITRFRCFFVLTNTVLECDTSQMLFYNYGYELVRLDRKYLHFYDFFYHQQRLELIYGGHYSGHSPSVKPCLYNCCLTLCTL